jgi:hypothetical protein
MIEHRTFKTVLEKLDKVLCSQCVPKVFLTTECAEEAG